MNDRLMIAAMFKAAYIANPSSPYGSLNDQDYLEMTDSLILLEASTRPLDDWPCRFRHNWVHDPDAGVQKCSRCGMERA